MIDRILNLFRGSPQSDASRLLSRLEERMRERGGLYLPKDLLPPDTASELQAAIKNKRVHDLPEGLLSDDIIAKINEFLDSEES